MATKEVVMERVFGLNPDAARLAYNGFGVGKLLNSPAKPSFSRAYDAFRDNCTRQGIDEGQSREQVWLPESIAGDVASAIAADTMRLVGIITAEPPYRSTSSELAKAVTEHLVGSEALIYLGGIASDNTTAQGQIET